MQNDEAQKLQRDACGELGTQIAAKFVSVWKPQDAAEQPQDTAGRP